MTLMVDGRPTDSSHRRLAWLDGFFWAMTRSSPHGREAQAKYTSVQLSICTGTRQSAQRNWPQTPSARTTPSILLSHLVGSQHSNQLRSTSLNLVYQQTPTRHASWSWHQTSVFSSSSCCASSDGLAHVRICPVTPISPQHHHHTTAQQKRASPLT